MFSTKKKILILGGESNLGIILANYLKRYKYSFISTTRNKKKIRKNKIYLNLLNIKNFVIPNNINIVFICASVTSISICEKNKKKTMETNVVNTCKLIKGFIDKNIHVVYFSTNLIFNNVKKKASFLSRYKPQNEYARQKVLVERYLKNLNNNNYTIIRFGKIIFAKDELLLSWLKKLKKDIKIKVIDGKFISPIYETDVIKFVKKIPYDSKNRIFQLSSLDQVSFYDIAIFFINKLNKRKDLLKLIQKKSSRDLILKCNIKNYKSPQSMNVVQKFYKNY